MKRFYKHPVKPEWGVTYVDLDECNDEFETFLFSSVGDKKLKVAIAKANLQALTADEEASLESSVVNKLKGFRKKEIFSSKPVVAAEKPKKEDDDIDFDDVDLGEDPDWLEEEEEIED